PPFHARRLAEALPACEKLTLLPDLGHMTPLEAPEQVSAELQELLRSHVAPAAATDSAAPPLEEAQ
ncbi:alpha/beta fold hydrolase, partial [Thermobifida fusca]